MTLRESSKFTSNRQIGVSIHSFNNNRISTKFSRIMLYDVASTTAECCAPSMNVRRVSSKFPEYKFLLLLTFFPDFSSEEFLRIAS